MLYCGFIHRSSGSIHYLVDEMEKKSQQLKESAADILRYMKVATLMHALKLNKPLQITCDMDVSVERANTLAVQMKMVYMSNMQHCKPCIMFSAHTVTAYLYRQYPRVAVCCRSICG